MVPPQPSLHDVKRLVTHAEHHHTGFSPTPVGHLAARGSA